MTPNSGKNASLNRTTRDELLKIIGHPSTTEAEWLDACAQLGDHPQPSTRSKRTSPVTLGLCALGSAALSTFAYMSVNNAALNSPLQVHEAPVVPQVQEGINYGPYMADMQRRIKRAWFPPKGKESKHVAVRFWAHKDGSIDKVRLYEPSGVLPYDQSCLKAVQNAAPLKSFPPGAPDKLEIEFTFDYNVHGNY